MSKAVKQPVESPIQTPKKYKKTIKNAKWIVALDHDEPKELINTLFEENERLRKELDQIKKINFAIKKEYEDLMARLIEERYNNLYPDEDGKSQTMELEN